MVIFYVKNKMSIRIVQKGHRDPVFCIAALHE
jgi:hypothetical protein